ncbi:Eukaryotic translation initiation factor 2-alpha kinase pek-1 [Folsomia candida]|uniref:non-specific serine/threonine protein kinase n=1 Tax=Folsomia candida TaxID=158441 RepID=A0A226EAH0_FOLCA|nr:Eukaryotic translation initiation factor 2-alpha kinase pek-1 [Folsomia candida]
MEWKPHNVKLTYSKTTLPISKAKHVSKLGSGSFGSVLGIKKLHHVLGETTAAVKLIPVSNMERLHAKSPWLRVPRDDTQTSTSSSSSSSSSLVFREIENCLKISHPNSVFTYKFGFTSLPKELIELYNLPSTDRDQSYHADDYDSCASETRLLGKFDYFGRKPGFADALWIQMELCGPTLRDWLEDNFDATDFRVALLQLGIVRGIIEGVKFLHHLNIIHRDIKPENIFFSNHPGYVLPVKIGDLGLSRRVVGEENFVWGESADSFLVDGNVQLTGNVGTPSYMAPEVGRGNYSLQADLFAFGLIMWEVLEFDKIRGNRTSMFYDLVYGGIEDIVNNHSIVKNSRELIINLTKRDPNLRMRSILDVKLDVPTPTTFFARDTAEFANCLEFCSDGDTINLGVGTFVGEFCINRNNITVQGDAKFGSVITSSFWGLLIQGDRNIVKDIKFDNCDIECIRIHGSYNNVSNIVMADSLYGIVTYSVPKLGFRGSYNQISNVSCTDVNFGIAMMGSHNRVKDITITRVRKDTAHFGGITVTWSVGNQVENYTGVGFLSARRDLGIKVRNGCATFRNCQCGRVDSRGDNVALENEW